MKRGEIVNQTNIEIQKRKGIMEAVDAELRRLNTTSVEVYRYHSKEGSPSLPVVYRIWGNWSNFIEELGYEVTHRRLSKQELIDKIIEQKKTLGRIPKAREIENQSALTRYFKTYSNAINEIFGVDRGVNSYSSKEEVKAIVVRKLEEYYRKNGQYPYITDWNANNMKPTNATINKWGLSYREIVQTLKKKREMTLF